jgi:hypothetical protein
MWPTATMTNTHPWSAFDPNDVPGSPYWMTDCVAPNVDKSNVNVYYPGFFRPDSEFNYTEYSCDIGYD